MVLYRVDPVSINCSFLSIQPFVLVYRYEKITYTLSITNQPNAIQVEEITGDLVISERSSEASIFQLVSILL